MQYTPDYRNVNLRSRLERTEMLFPGNHNFHVENIVERLGQEYKSIIAVYLLY